MARERGGRLGDGPDHQLRRRFLLGEARDEREKILEGVAVSIHVAGGAGEPMRPVGEARAVAGRGLEGDRYFEGRGFNSNHPGPEREVTLIEEESIEALARDHGLRLEPGETRRNITTRGAPLNHLAGRRFRVGGAILRGVELCEPCKHLVDVTQKRSLLPTLVHRGGLHAQVLEGGGIRVRRPRMSASLRI